MSTMLIANNETRESGSFMGDQCCSLKAAYLFVEYAPPGTDHIIMSVSPGNEMHFLWEKFIDKHNVELIHDNWNPGDWTTRHAMWDKWRTERCIEGKPFQHYRELYLRIHGAQRQTVLCNSERGLGKRNIYQYWWCGQEGSPPELPPEVDWFDDTLIYHPALTRERDVYISPHAKTQGNSTFTFLFWEDVVHRLVDAGVSVTVGYDGAFCEDLAGHHLYHKHWGNHQQWMDQVCRHRLVACGNTGTGWLAAACGVPMITMEPHNSIMADHRYRQCGLRNIIEVVDGYKLDEMKYDMRVVADYVARRIASEVGKGARYKETQSLSSIISYAAGYSVNPPGKLRTMAEALFSVKDLPGEVADLGAMRGGCSLILRQVAPEKELHIFDTWEGTPYDDPLCHHKKGEWATSLEECRKLVGTNERTYYHPGIFPVDSPDYIKENKYCFVYVDMDTEQATRDAIEFFWPRMVPGGLMVFDDYGWIPCAGVKVAVDDKFGEARCKVIGYTCIVLKEEA